MEEKVNTTQPKPKFRYDIVCMLLGAAVSAGGIYAIIEYYHEAAIIFPLTFAPLIICLYFVGRYVYKYGKIRPATLPQVIINCIILLPMAGFAGWFAVGRIQVRNTEAGLCALIAAVYLIFALSIMITDHIKYRKSGGTSTITDWNE